MPVLYRAFNDRFISHMDQRAWPPISVVRNWFKDRRIGLKRDRYTELKRGDGLAEKYAYSLARLLLEESRKEAPRAFGLAFKEFVEANGITATAAYFDDILTCICAPPRHEPWIRDTGDDLLGLGLQGLDDLVDTKRLLERHICLCRHEEDVRNAVEWLFVYVGRSINPSLSLPEATALATQYMRTTPDDYHRYAMQWWRFNPWTVVLAQGKRRPIGVSILLPLTKVAYESVLDGNQMTYQTTAEQLANPSPILLHEIVAARPRDMGGEAISLKDATRALYATVIAQCGVFTHSLPAGASDPMRLLSFPGTPENAKRLQAFGYRSTGKSMPGTGLPYVEKLWPLNSTNTRAALLIALIRHYGELMDGRGRPENDGGTQGSASD
jgi:hypothetical protein